MFAFLRRPAALSAEPNDWVADVFAKFAEGNRQSTPAPLDFAGTLSRLARERGFNQASFARHIGISPRRMGHYFNGERRPDFELLLTMADALGVHVGVLLGRPPGATFVAGVGQTPEAPR